MRVFSLKLKLLFILFVSAQLVCFISCNEPIQTVNNNNNNNVINSNDLEENMKINYERINENEKTLKREIISTWEKVYSEKNITKLIIETDEKFQALKKVTDLNTRIFHRNFRGIGTQAHAFYELSILIQRAEKDNSIPKSVFKSSLDRLKKDYKDIEKKLFPFLSDRSNKLLKSFDGRGIVIGVGSRYVKLAYWLISSIRNIFNCKLPIEIACIDKEELDDDQKNLLGSFEDVSFIYISDHISGNYAQPKSYAAKVFGMLFSSFNEVLWLDADTVILISPELFFDIPEYIQSGALYWYDRKIIHHKPARLPINFILNGEVREEIEKSMIYRDPPESSHLLETGVVVYNKQKHFHSLLLTCRLNCKNERQTVSWNLFLGEKETFWLAHEMIHDYNYHIVPYPAGVVGCPLIHSNYNLTGIFGRLAHFDRDGKLLWWNGGLVENKYEPYNVTTKLIDFEVYSYEYDDSFWHNLQWMYTPTLKQIEENDLLLIKQFVDIWRSLSDHEYFGMRDKDNLCSEENCNTYLD